jgi:hypothetical protein
MTLDFADLKPSILNWILVGLMAVTFIAFFKWFSTRYSIPGLTPLIQSV